MCNTTKLMFCIGGLVLSSAVGRASEIHVTVPVGLDGMNSNAGLSHQGGLREQGVYVAEAFESVPGTHRKIIGYALRPAVNQDAPAEITFSDVEIRLSTTTAAPGDLSMTYADNIGPDETLVFAGELNIATGGVLSGGRREFDMHVDFQTPFEYDPAQGNLLFEFRSRTSTGLVWVDGHVPGDGTRHVNGSNSPTRNDVARRSQQFSFVRRFTVVPEPSSLSMSLLAFLLSGIISRPAVFAR